MVGPTKTNYYHSTSSEWPSSNRPDFPPASPCGNREFLDDVPHRNRDHQTYGAVRRVHSFFPYNVTDARIAQLQNNPRMRQQQSNKDVSTKVLYGNTSRPPNQTTQIPRARASSA